MLRLFLDTSNKYFSLTKDLSLTEFSQIDNSDNSFKGVFNGNNHIIPF